MGPVWPRGWGRGIALLFLDLCTRSAAVKERPSTHFTGGWMSPRASLDGRKIYPPGFYPGPSSP